MRKPESQPEPIPVSMPLIVLDVHADGTVAVTVDGKPLDPVPGSGVGPWRRSSFGQIIDRATNEGTTPARVEVREADGTTFTDIIAPRRRRPSRPQPTPERSSLPVFHTVTGGGFVPGEDVAVAVVTGHTDASGAGTARALIAPARLGPDASGGVVEVLLVGRISGTTIIRRLP